MNLSLLRHGDAEKYAENDSVRTLTPRGEEQTAALAAFLSKTGVRFDRIFSSPLVRARRTAKIFADGLGLEDAIAVDNRLACGSHLKNVLDILRENRDAEEVLMVGHAPDLGVIAAELLGLCAELPFKKGAILKMSASIFRAGNARMVYFLPPSLFPGK